MSKAIVTARFELDMDLVPEENMPPEEWLRRECTWLEDIGIELTDTDVEGVVEDDKPEYEPDLESEDEPEDESEDESE